MPVLQNKIDFCAVLTCKNANPNGDPLSGNQPRKTYEGYGEITDVCIKRKIRNRLMDMGAAIFVQSDDRRTDAFTCLRKRADANDQLKACEKKKDRDGYAKIACESWMDVRSFGQVFAFDGEKKGGGLSCGIRGPVSIQSAFSVEPVDVVSTQITKSVNNVEKEEGKKSSDTMGVKHRVSFGVYVLKGSINVQLAEKTGFTTEDAEMIKEALRTLFVNDCSSARPEGSMTVEHLYWWRHSCKLGQYSAAKVHQLLDVRYKAEEPTNTMKDYEVSLASLDGLDCEVLTGE